MMSRVEVSLVWLLGHASQVWPFLVFAIILILSWGELRQFTMGGFRAALRGLDRSWLVVAAVATIANVAVMGLYDVIAFQHTRSRWSERWRFVAVAIAFTSGLIGWTLAVLLAARVGANVLVLSVGAFALVLAATSLIRAMVRGSARFAAPGSGQPRALELAVVGWLDWLLAGTAFIACVRATGASVAATSLTESFF